MRVLVVDDDAVALIAARGLVNVLGHSCVTARSGQEAWVKLENESFDAVVSDRMMPDVDGLELCRRIRRRGPDVPYVYVIIASGMIDVARARDGMQAGADGYVAKPLTREKLQLELIAAERVSALHRRLEALNQDLLGANAELLSANQFQADVIAMLGHDARQPLTGILGYSEVLSGDWDGTGEDTRKHMAARINRAARGLDQLLDDVLTMANLESGAITCEPRPVDLAEIVREVLAMADDEDLVQVEVPPGQEVLVDRWQLRQMLANLVGNSLKYGEPPFRMTATAVDEAAVQIAISDAGQGVPADFVPRLFDRFSRATSGVATQKKGSGFGLYIVRELALANGGTIEYVPVQPHGASFLIRLPVPAGGPVVPGQPVARPQTGDLAGPTVSEV